MKRRRVRERDEADARERADRRRQELLEHLKARELARRKPAAPEAPDPAEPDPEATDVVPPAPETSERASSP